MDGQEMIKLETPGGLVVAPNWGALAALHAKIASASKEIGAVTKDKENTHFKYAYVSYEQTAAEVRSAFAKAGLSFAIGAHSPEMNGDLCTLHVECCITDTETGAMRIMNGIGQGKDSQDKAASKALTSGVKYMLMRALLFTDNEADSDAAEGWGAWPVNKRDSFWAKMTELHLDKKTVHDEFNVSTMKDYRGSMGDAGEVYNILKYGIDATIGIVGVHQALGVSRVCEWTGGLNAAKAKIDAYIDAKSRDGGQKAMPMSEAAS